MKAVSSPLEQLSFDIINSKISTIFSDDTTIDLILQTKSYPIDIDYTIKHQSDQNIFVILVSIAINAEEQPGYSISVEGAGVFTFSEIVDDNHKQALLHSAVIICITNLRAYINSTTSYFPIGRFSFNVIDMVKLFKSKSEA